MARIERVVFVHRADTGRRHAHRCREIALNRRSAHSMHGRRLRDSSHVEKPAAVLDLHRQSDMPREAAIQTRSARATSTMKATSARRVDLRHHHEIDRSPCVPRCRSDRDTLQRVEGHSCASSVRGSRNRARRRAHDVRAIGLLLRSAGTESSRSTQTASVVTRRGLRNERPFSPRARTACFAASSVGIGTILRACAALPRCVRRARGLSPSPA